MAVAIPVTDGMTVDVDPQAKQRTPTTGGGQQQEQAKKGLDLVKKMSPKSVAPQEAPRSQGKKKVGNKVAVSNLSSPPDAATARAYMCKHDWPAGVQTNLLRSCEKYPIRYFIIDDSGSMNTNDGHRIIGEAPNQKMIKCTRWSELTSCLKFYAELSHAARAPTEFRFLNMAEPIVVGMRGDDEGRGLEAFLSVIKDEQPGGQTPLCQQVLEVIASIKSYEQELRAAGQLAVVVVATDGEATDGDLVEAMRELQYLPVWLVIRICCDTPEIIEYWNGIDGELEIDMDVLDDIAGEAEEIKSANPWLRYSEPLHKLREFGSCLREMDLVDESLLTSEQMTVVCNMLLCGPDDPPLPSPDIDYAAFLQCVQAQMRRVPQIFDPIETKMVPPINLLKLAESYDAGMKKSSSCAVM